MRYDSARVLARLIGKWYCLILISPNYALLFLFLLVLHSCTKTSNEPPSAIDGKELRREDAVAGNRAGATNTPNATACDYENEASSLGVGLIIAPPSFTLWNDSATTVEYLSFSTTAEQPSSGICPKFYEPEYGIIHFVWLASYSDAYAVLADSGTVKYIRSRHMVLGLGRGRTISCNLSVCEGRSMKQVTRKSHRSYERSRMTTLLSSRPLKVMRCFVRWKLKGIG